jgi:hypothetical protein
MRAFRLAVLALVAATVAVPAQAASLLEKNFWLSGPNYHGILPYCEAPAVSGKIASQFASREQKYWASNLRIEGFDRIREIAYRPWGPDYIPRRFCTARVLTSDGHYRSVSYFIAEDLGFAGFSWGVTWCVAGLDRNLAFAPNCKMARP